MTPEERFERIERNLELLAQGQIETDKQLKSFMVTTGSFIATAEVSMKHQTAMMATLVETTTHMDRILTELVQAITTQRANGKAK